MSILFALNEEENRLCQVRKLSKGETLFHENDECFQIGIVKKGKLIITSFPENGRQIIYNRLEKDEMFGNNLIFSSSPFYKGDVIALENSEIILIGKEVLIFLLQKNRRFLIEYLRLQADDGKNLHSRIRFLSIDSASERFLAYMHEHGGTVTIATVSALADELSLSRETLSRLLSSLQAAKSIIRDGKTIRLL